MKAIFIASCFLLLASSAPSSAFAQGGVTRFCTPGAGGSRISAAGSASFTAGAGSGDLVLHASNVPPGSTGVFFYGDAATPSLPLGNGFRCVGGALFRLPAVATGPGQNSLSLAVDYLDPPSSGGAITPGSTWNFQCWFRSGGSVDLSDAIEIRFGPSESLTSWSTLLTGDRSMHPFAQTVGGVVIVSSAAEWTSFWSVHTSGATPPPPPPAVDFTQEAVVAVFAGWRGTSGYSIRVQRLHLSIATLDVRSLERTPGTGCGVVYSERQPFHFVRVPRIEHLAPGDWSAVRVAYTCP